MLGSLFLLDCLHFALVPEISKPLPPFTEQEAGDNCLGSHIPWGNFQGPSLVKDGVLLLLGKGVSVGRVLQLQKTTAVSSTHLH